MFILPLQVSVPPQLLVVFDFLLLPPDLVLLPVLPALSRVVLVSLPAGGQLGVRGGGCGGGGVQGGGGGGGAEQTRHGGGFGARVLSLVRGLVVGEQTGSCTCAAGLLVKLQRAWLVHYGGQVSQCTVGDNVQ